MTATTKRRVVKKKASTTASPKAPTVSPVERIKNQLRNFRDMRKAHNDLDVAIKKGQQELLAALADIDSDNNGIVFDEDDESKGAAYKQQNAAGTYWNMEKVIEWLKKNPAMWRACSSRVFDAKKWEAEVANGNIPKKIAEGFKETGEPPAPFIRFGKPNKDSLR